MEMQDFLISLGISPHYTGFKFLCDLVSDYGRNQDSSMGQRYERVALHYNTTWQCVERNVRSVITALCDDVPPDTYVSKLQQCPAMDTGTYTNGSFIALAWFAFKRAGGMPPAAAISGGTGSEAGSYATAERTT